MFLAIASGSDLPFIATFSLTCKMGIEARINGGNNTSDSDKVCPDPDIICSQKLALKFVGFKASLR